MNFFFLVPLLLFFIARSKTEKQIKVQSAALSTGCRCGNMSPVLNALNSIGLSWYVAVECIERRRRRTLLPFNIDEPDIHVSDIHRCDEYHYEN